MLRILMFWFKYVKLVTRIMNCNLETAIIDLYETLMLTLCQFNSSFCTTSRRHSLCAQSLLCQYRFHPFPDGVHHTPIAPAFTLHPTIPSHPSHTIKPLITHQSKQDPKKNYNHVRRHSYDIRNKLDSLQAITNQASYPSSSLHCPPKSVRC